MPVTPKFNPDYLYFVTSVAQNHIHFFEPDSVKRILLDSLNFLRTSGRINLYAFVLMPNHVHFIARFVQPHTLSQVMRDFKRHTARQIILQCAAQNSKWVDLMRSANHAPDQEYKVWEDGYDAREIFTWEFMEQKMNYLHNNPCQEHWKLSVRPEEYPWSSARFYFTDKPCFIPIDDVRVLSLFQWGDPAV